MNPTCVLGDRVSLRRSKATRHALKQMNELAAKGDTRLVRLLWPALCNVFRDDRWPARRSTRNAGERRPMTRTCHDEIGTESNH